MLILVVVGVLVLSGCGKPPPPAPTQKELDDVMRKVDDTKPKKK